jgi:hypothetical protein
MWECGRRDGGRKGGSCRGGVSGNVLGVLLPLSTYEGTLQGLNFSAVAVIKLVIKSRDVLPASPGHTESKIQ